MKKGVLFVVLLFGVLAALAAQSSTMYVAVKSVVLKASDGFFAASRGILGLGDVVIVMQKKKDWFEVRSGAQNGLSGWVPAASLTTKKIVRSAGTSALASEVALAGKGFSKDLEKSYQDEEGVNYSAVNDMESLSIPERELYDFITEGHLSKGE